MMVSLLSYLKDANPHGYKAWHAWGPWWWQVRNFCKIFLWRLREHADTWDYCVLSAPLVLFPFAILILLRKEFCHRWLKCYFFLSVMPVVVSFTRVFYDLFDLTVFTHFYDDPHFPKDWQAQFDCAPYMEVTRYSAALEEILSAMLLGLLVSVPFLIIGWIARVRAAKN